MITIMFLFRVFFRSWYLGNKSRLSSWFIISINNFRLPQDAGNLWEVLWQIQERLSCSLRTIGRVEISRERPYDTVCHRERSILKTTAVGTIATWRSLLEFIVHSWYIHGTRMWREKSPVLKRVQSFFGARTTCVQGLRINPYHNLPTNRLCLLDVALRHKNSPLTLNYSQPNNANK